MTTNTDDFNEHNDEINGQDSASISYRSADIIGQVERLRCSIIGLLNENAALRIELQCQSHRHAPETGPPSDSRACSAEWWSV